MDNLEHYPFGNILQEPHPINRKSFGWGCAAVLGLIITAFVVAAL